LEGPPPVYNEGAPPHTKYSPRLCGLERPPPAAHIFSRRGGPHTRGGNPILGATPLGGFSPKMGRQQILPKTHGVKNPPSRREKGALLKTGRKPTPKREGGP